MYADEIEMEMAMMESILRNQMQTLRNQESMFRTSSKLRTYIGSRDVWQEELKEGELKSQYHLPNRECPMWSPFRKYTGGGSGLHAL
ncbi:hypothetical protein Syun_021222 [Stephania yunnanensis]|uniref:Uncharacterized protein n=1 Tax=Stephania yunnanensis TaxID=152371 RepID=A0AAP0IFM9_9MAGN